METSSIDLPDEIIELILSKCPIKSVVKFKLVSKSWQSIISDPRFSRIHYIQQSRLPENQNKFIVMGGYRDDHPFYFIRWENGKFRTELVLQNPFSRKGIDLLSSCDGLILLENYDAKEEEYILWNPSIRKHIVTPAFNVPFNDDDIPCLHHLYFDSITNDYKIVFVYDSKCYTVYSCKNGSWGEIKDIPGFLRPKVCVDGCIYDKCKGEILCFDARDGKLHKFPQPNDVEGLVQVELKDISGRLCFIKWSEDYHRLRHLWVMEKNGSFEKSWRKLISIEKEEPRLWVLRPLCLTNEDDVVLFAVTEYGYCNLYKYNPCENCFQVIEFAWEVSGSSQFFSYSENLYMHSSNIC